MILYSRPLFDFTVCLTITHSLTLFQAKPLYRVHARFCTFGFIPVFMQPPWRLENLATLEQIVHFFQE